MSEAESWLTETHDRVLTAQRVLSEVERGLVAVEKAELIAKHTRPFLRMATVVILGCLVGLGVALLVGRKRQQQREEVSVREEGWYTDPYELHERRWFSDGTPTKLVSDNGVASSDPPPNTPYVTPPEPLADSGGLVDDGSINEDSGVKGAREVFVETGGD